MNQPFQLKLNDYENKTFTESLTTIITEPETQTAILNHNNTKNTYIETFENNFPERLTIKDIISFWKKWYHLDIDVEHTLYQYHLFQDRNQRVKNLNVSQLKLLKLIKISLLPTKNILIQELLFGLDVKTKNSIISLIAEITQTKNIICLTNNMSESYLISDFNYTFHHNQLKIIDTKTEEEDNNNSDDVTSDNEFKIKPVKRLTVRINNNIIVIDPLEIDYIESHEGKAYIYLNAEKFAHESSMQDLEKLLCTHGFYRCHRSYIVNLQKVSEIVTWSKNSYSVRLNQSKDTLVPVSRSKIKDLEAHFDI